MTTPATVISKYLILGRIHMKLTRKTCMVALAFGLGLTLSACSGGSDSNNGSGGTNGGSSGGGGSTGSSSRDLPSFASVWTAYNMLQSIPTLLMFSGQNGNMPPCVVSTDAANTVTTIQKCKIGFDPNGLYTGTLKLAAYTPTPGSNNRFAQISSAQIEVDDPISGQPQYFITQGSFSGQVNDSSTGDTISFSAPTGFTARTSASSKNVYAFSLVTAVPGVAVSINNNLWSRTSTNLTFTVSNGTDSWQVQTSAPITETGSNRPSQGSLRMVRTGASQALNVAFNGNSLTFSGGEDGNSAVNHNWTDSDVQSALKTAQQ